MLDIKLIDCTALGGSSMQRFGKLFSRKPKINCQLSMVKEYIVKLEEYDADLAYDLDSSMGMEERIFKASENFGVKVDSHMAIYKSGANITKGEYDNGERVLIIDISDLLDLVLSYCSGEENVLDLSDIKNYKNISSGILSGDTSDLSQVKLKSMIGRSRGLDIFLSTIIKRNLASGEDLLPWFIHQGILVEAQEFMVGVGSKIVDYIKSQGGICKLKSYSTNEIIMVIDRNSSTHLDNITIEGRLLDYSLYGRLEYGID